MTTYTPIANLLYNGLPVYTATPSPTPSPPGSSITNTSGGSLVTADGTWTFGHIAGSTGNQTLLNGSNANNGYGVLLEIYTDGKIYQKNSAGSWYAYSSGNNAWAPTSGPGPTPSPSPTPTPTPTPTPGGKIPYMVGVKMGNSQTDNTTFAGWLKRPVDIVGATITTTGWIGGNNKPYSPTNTGVDISFPMISIFGESPSIHDMAVAASGGYDATYTAMAKAVAALGSPCVTFSPGWEQSGQWYGWSIGAGSPYQGALNPSLANYIAAFKRIATIMKQYNPNALAQFCFAIGRDPTGYWPGAFDAVKNPGGVDVISCDFYQSNVKTDTGDNTFNGALNGYGGVANLTWMVNFAQKNGIGVGLREWGAGPGGGAGSGKGANDGTYVAACLAWYNSLPASLQRFLLYSNDPPADDIVTVGANPAEQAAYVTQFAGTSFSGPWWKGPPVA